MLGCVGYVKGYVWLCRAMSVMYGYVGLCMAM